MNNIYLEWSKSRKKFMVPLLIILFLFYFSLPFSLIFIPEYINIPTAIWDLPLIWVYAFLQLIMTLVIMHLYIRKAKKLDEIINKMRKEK